MKKRILVLYQDWENWFLKDYSKFEYWFKKLDGAYSNNNEYYVLSLSNFNRKIRKEGNVFIELFKSSPKKQILDLFILKRRIKRIIKNFKPDYIYTPFIYMGAFIPRTKAKKIGFLRDITAEIVKSKGGYVSFLGNMFYILDFFAFRKFDLILYNSVFVSRYSHKLGYKKEKHFCPRPILDHSKNKKEINKIIGRYGLKNKKVILTIARLSKEKNLGLGIKALRNMPKNYVYLIVGAGEENNLKKLAKELKLENRVIFVGSIPHKNVWAFYYASDVFWLLSSTESCPNVINEAFYAKLPCVVSNIPTMKKMIKNNLDGVMIKSFNPRGLSEKTLNLLQDQKLYNTIKKNEFIKISRIKKFNKKVVSFFI